jgi:hypothetical protein
VSLEDPMAMAGEGRLGQGAAGIGSWSGAASRLRPWSKADRPAVHRRRYRRGHRETALSVALDYAVILGLLAALVLGIWAALF